MKFIVSSTALSKAVEIVAAVIGSNSVIPILQSIRFKVVGNDLHLMASDLQTLIETSVEVQVERSGEVAIPAKIFSNTIRSIPEQPIEIEIDETTYGVTIKSVQGVYKFMGEPTSEFPVMNEAPQSMINMDAGQLNESIGQVLFAASRDELRPQMTGIYFDFSPEGTNVVATDAHKLARVSCKLETTHNAELIVPAKACRLLRDALDRHVIDDPVVILYSEKNVRFITDSITIDSRLIVGSYPDYRAVIPRNNTNDAVFDRADLVQSLKRVGVFASQQTSQVILNFDGKGGVELISQDFDFSNEARETLTCEHSGEPFQIAFNGKYFLSVLSTIKSDQVRLSMGPATRAALVFPVDSELDAVFLIMPLMITVDSSNSMAA